MACLPVLIHAEDRGQRQGSPFMEALTEPEHVILARLASQQAPAILVSNTGRTDTLCHTQLSCGF